MYPDREASPKMEPRRRFNPGYLSLWWAGALLLGASLAYLPPEAVMAYHFDAIKRGLMSLLIAGVALLSGRACPACRDHKRLLLCLDLLLLWVFIRWIAQENPWRETSVMAAWSTSLLALRAGLMTGPDFLRHITPWVTGAGIIQIAIMQAQRFDLWTGLTLGIDQPSARMIGTIGYHNQGADFLAVTLAVAPWLTPVCRWPLMAGTLITIFMTACRGASAGVLVGLGCIMAGWLHAFHSRYGRRTLLVAAFTGLGIIMATGYFSGLSDRVRVLLDDPMHPRAGLASRVWMWRVGLDLLAGKPWLGWGPGAFAYQYVERLGDLLPESKTHRLMQQITFAREAHHEGLQFALEFGAVGCLFLLFALLFLCRILLRHRHHKAAATGLFILGYAAIQSQLSFLWQTAVAGPLMALLLGASMAGVADDAPEKKNIRFTSSATTARYVAAMLAAFLLVLFYITDLKALRRISMVGHADQAWIVESTLPPWGHAYRAHLAGFLLKTDCAPDGVAWLESVLKNYMDIHLLNNLGAGYAQLGQWQKALDVYNTWLRSGIQHRDALHNVSVAYEKLGRYREAADALKEKRQLWGEFAPGQEQRLLVLYLLAGEPDRVLNLLRDSRQRRAQLTTHHKVALMNIKAAALMSKNSYANAERILRNILILDPDNVVAMKNLQLLDTKND